MMTLTRTEESTAVAATAIVPTLLLAFELGERTWKLGFTTGLGQQPRIRQIPARATDRLVEELARAKARFKLPADAPVMSCYEAGRDGFWLHRWLVAHAVNNHVIDSSSIEVNRRARRVKTDRLDLVACCLCSRATNRAIDGGAWCACPRSPRRMRGSSIGHGRRSNRIGIG
jgi:hypothetical protein